MFLEEPAVGLVTHTLQQGSDGHLDVADGPQINARPPPDVFGVFVDLDFLHTIAGKEF